MNLDEFLKKYKVSKRDTNIVKSLYSDEDKSEKDWVKFLSTKVVLTKPTPTKEDLKAEIAKKKLQKSEGKKSNNNKKE